ncbi:MAG: hypothetical protein AAF639_17975 [Chloroflexota bacterium]
MFNHNLTEFIGRPVRTFFPDEGISYPHNIYRISVDYDDEPTWATKFAQFVNDPQVIHAQGVVIGAWMGMDVDISSAHIVSHLVDAFYTGIDLLFTPDLRRHYLLELNAFGDLLLRVYRDGMDTYEMQIRHFLATQV